MKSLQIDEKKARSIYATAPPELKVMLEDTFTKEYFSMNIMDRIKKWEDAATELGIDPIESLPFPNPKNNREVATNAFFKLDAINQVLLEGVVLDWTNTNQKKWYPWFNEYRPGSGFSFYGTCCGWTATLANGGARLCLDTEKKAAYFGKQFLSIFNEYLNPIK